MKNYLYQLARLAASGLGSGFAARAPGTCGTAACLLLWWLLTLFLGGMPSFTTALLMACAAWSIGHAAILISADEGVMEGYDPQWIVVDEWAGMLFAMLGYIPFAGWLGAGFQAVEYLIPFVLFRLFDITKLGPVGWAEKLPGAWGIMTDDVIAGILAALVLAGALSVLR